jgi:protease-4
MNSTKLLSAVLRGKWAIDPIFALSQGAVIANLINPATVLNGGEVKKISAYAISPKAANGTQYSYRDGFSNAPVNSVAVIRISGPLMKEDQYCGPIGMETIGQIIKEADSNPNIEGIVLQIDSPGGTVDGTETLGNIVKNAQKPVVTFVDGLMCSAALWIGSSADEVIASTSTDEIGSVGVLVQFADLQPMLEAQGVAFHIVKASTSVDKVKMWEDLRAGKYDEYIQQILDPLDEKFMNTIRSNCANVQDKHLTGKVFFARDVLGVYVNSIGTISDAIQRASELAPAKKNKATFTRTLSQKAIKPGASKQASNKASMFGEPNWTLINSLAHNIEVDLNM